MIVPINRRELLTGTAGIVLLSVCGGAALANDVFGKINSQRQLDIDRLTEKFMQDFSIPGLSFAFGQRGKVKYAAAYGSADAYQTKPLEVAHRFRIASLSKPITSATIMVLRDEGKIHLSDRVFGENGLLGTKYLKDVTSENRKRLEQIEVRHLLSHTTGAWINDENDPMFIYPHATHDSLIPLILENQPMKSGPGVNYAYSNFGYCLLGRIIEEMTSQSYEQFVTNEILSRCGIEDMEIAGNTRWDRKTKEVEYFDPEYDYAYAMNVARMDSHGGWIGTPSDYIRFISHVDGYKSTRDIISQESSRLMAKPTKASSYYGHGWQINPVHSNRWHTGSLPGTTSIGVRVKGGASFAGFANIRSMHDKTSSAAGLDRFMWSIYKHVIG